MKGDEYICSDVVDVLYAISIIEAQVRLCQRETKSNDRTFLREQHSGTMTRSILTLFPSVISPPLLLNGFLALTGRKKQSLSLQESRVLRGMWDFLNGTFIFKYCAVIGWLQEAGTWKSPLPAKVKVFFSL